MVVDLGLIKVIDGKIEAFNRNLRKDIDERKVNEDRMLELDSHILVRQTIIASLVELRGKEQKDAS